MAITILTLPNGHLSLEFDVIDLPNVIAAVRKHYGVPLIQQYPVLAVFAFGGCSFTFQNEWDDPCLISSSSDGDEILNKLCAELNG
ncbi:hypothetical protein [Sphingobium sp.]|uniref:hypothetical protein n=1 Tax=Sphingobium sp. TaxID=1912891 RepID=UPI0025EF5F82|nr:hypothetical protein [Sphingobium sp.]